MKMFDVTASRSQGWWAIHTNVPGASVWTQARRLDQVEATAREAIGLALDAAQDSFELNIAPVVPEGIRHEVELARNTARLAAIAQAIATTLNQYAAVSLTAEGYTVRDAGYLMNLSSQRISQLVAQQRARFLERWQEALKLGGQDAVPSEAAQDRALSESTAFAIRIDVAEELTRLAAHLDEIERLLDKGGEVGKRLDFLIQELHREANTLGSKSAALELTRISVDMKVLIEQMREQVQNIE